jgi:hypothetical protein
VWKAASAGLHEMEDDAEAEAGRVLPTVQAAQAPEQAAEARPAWSPNVPAGHAVHAAALVAPTAADAVPPGHLRQPVDDWPVKLL